MMNGFDLNQSTNGNGDCALELADVEQLNPSVDLDRIRRAVTEILLAVGEDPDREGLRETPDRVANVCRGVSGPQSRSTHAS